MTESVFSKLFCYLLEPQCPVCLRPVFTISLCPRCSCWPRTRRWTQFDWLSSTYQLTHPARIFLHSIKYGHHFERLRLISPLLPLSFPWNFNSKTVLIPVPLSQVRFNERGFNQSEWLARQMSKRTQLKIEIKGLKKTRETSPQSTLSRSERQKNLVGAFSWNPKRPAPERVCLIDDVLTTGSTLEACKSALQKAGVKEIFAWTLFEATTDILNRR